MEIDQLVKQAKRAQADIQKRQLRDEVQKIKKLVNSFLNTLKFTMIIPNIVSNNYELMKPHLSSMDLQDIDRVLRKINFNECTLQPTEMARNSDEIKDRLISVLSACNYENLLSICPSKTVESSKEAENLFNIVYALFNNDGINRLCDENMLQQIPDHIKNLISQFEILFDQILTSMVQCPKDAIAKEESLARKYKARKVMVEEVNSLVSTLKPKIEANEKFMQSGWDHTNLLQQQKTMLHKYCDENIDKFRNDTEKQMAVELKESEDRLEVIKSTINKLSSDYDKLKVENMAEEKLGRAKMFKIEQQLNSVVNKYEIDMLAKKEKYEELQKSYQDELKIMNMLERIYNKQEKNYTLLMKEKQDYEQAIWNAQLYEIQKKIAARKIQRFYRSYLAFLIAHGKKGKRKGKGKKK